MEKTNVPSIRINYRHETLMEERFMILGAFGSKSNSPSVSRKAEVSLKVFANEPLLPSPLVKPKRMSVVLPEFNLDNVDDVEALVGKTGNLDLEADDFDDC